MIYDIKTLKIPTKIKIVDKYMSNIFTGDWFGDCAIMTDYLDEVDYYSGTERKKMLKVPSKIGGSMLYGITWRGYLSPTKMRTKDEETGLYKTKVKDDYPELESIFKEFAFCHFPWFSWSQVQMNKNFPCPPHRDSKNIGESVLCCFGDFTGGMTGVNYAKDTESPFITYYDASKSPVQFNGAKFLHWVEPFEGTRYSLVFYNNYKLTKKNKI